MVRGSSQVTVAVDDKLYVRHGDCDGCVGLGLTPAACCQYLELSLAQPLTADQKRWAELHAGVTIRDGGSTVRIDAVCEALDGGRCSLYGKPDRPRMCVEAPVRPEQVIEGCAYELEEITV